MGAPMLVPGGYMQQADRDARYGGESSYSDELGNQLMQAHRVVDCMNI